MPRNKKSTASPVDRPSSKDDLPELSPDLADSPPATHLSASDLHYRLIERLSPPSILVNADHDIVHVSENASRFLRFSADEPSRNLLRAVHPSLRAELRAALDTAAQTRQPATAVGVIFEAGDTRSRVDLMVCPVGALARDFLLVGFLTKTGEESARSGLANNAQTNETSAQLKANNEELQASREGLSSINQELKRVNEELSGKVDQLGRANDDLRNLMSATAIATVFLDRELRITRYTPLAVALFNFIPSDLGRPLADLAPRLDYPEIVADAQQALAHLTPAQREVRAAGRWFLSRTLPYRSTEGSIAGVVFTFLDITMRKEAEEALRLSDSRLRMATDAAELGIWTWDIVNDRVTWENDWPYEFFGIARSDGPINAARFKAEFLDPDDAEQFGSAVADVFEAGHRFSFIGRMLRQSGEIRWVEFSGQPIADVAGKVTKMHGTAADVTARKAQQLALERSEARLRRVFESNVVGMIRWDLDQSLILDANDEFLRMTGYTRDDLAAGRVNFRALTPADWTPRNEDGIRKIREQGFAAPYEKEYIRKDGSRLPLIIAGTRFDDSPAEGMSFLIDISERKRAEAAVRQNAVLFSTLIEQAPMGVYVVDSQFRLQQINALALPAFEKAYPRIGRDFSEVMEILWGPEVGGKIASIFRRTLETGEYYISPPFSEYRQDLGEERSYEWQTQRVTLPDGECGVVCYFRDVTEHARSERALREAKEAAEKANQSKDRFLALLSHELRTPLMPVMMAVGALEHDQNLRPDVREDLAMIKRNIELETKLIDDLLDLSRITSGKVELKIEAVDLNEAVRHVCAICRPQLVERDVHLETDFDINAGIITADPARLRQVLWNVLKNAVKFTPAQGNIRVSTARLDRDRCEVRVQDTGIGIPPDVLPRIFNPFEQGEVHITRRFGGLGLGLAISRALVELQEGTIRAESEGQSKGATFIVELPGRRPS